MAFNEIVAMRARDALQARGAKASEKRMMGGMIFLINGNMLMGLKTLKTGQEQFMFRVGKDHEDEALAIPGTRPMVHGGRRMLGFLFINEDACPAETFTSLMSMAHDYVSSLQSK